MKVTNDGSLPVTLTGMSTTGEFAETNTCGASLAAHATCSIRITFKPVAAGNGTGTIILTGNASNCPELVELAGKGTKR
jgi:hypothetical protein